MSPLSVGIVFEQIKRGASMDLKSVFEMEFKISQGFMEHTEFFEGIRALLVDKDRSPKWRHSSILDVKKEEVESFFNMPHTLNLDISKYNDANNNSLFQFDKPIDLIEKYNELNKSSEMFIVYLTCEWCPDCNRAKPNIMEHVIN